MVVTERRWGWWGGAETCYLALQCGAPAGCGGRVVAVAMRVLDGMSFKLSDPRVYEPQIPARLGNTAHEAVIWQTVHSRYHAYIVSLDMLMPRMYRLLISGRAGAERGAPAGRGSRILGGW